MITDALVGFLGRQGALAALVGGRIFPAMGENGALPQIVATVVSHVPVHAMDGVSGLACTHYQLDCWADSYAGAEQLARALAGAVDGYAGPLTLANAAAPVTAQCVFVTAVRDGLDASPGLETQREYEKIVEIMIWHN